MRILFCGDVVGKAGRKIVGDNLLLLKDKYALDVIVINAENASHGFGLTTKAFQGFKKAGADVLTLGNHSFDKPEVASLLEDPTNAVIRPLNYPENTVGQGFIIYTLLKACQPRRSGRGNTGSHNLRDVAVDIVMEECR